MKWKIPLFMPDFGKKEISAVQRPIRRQWLTMGEEVIRVEERLKKETGARYAFLVTNCTAALHLAAVSMNIGPGDEVLCPTMTFVASANAIRAVGAKVIFCESAGEKDLTIDVEDIEKNITSRTKAIVCVHYAGFPCNMSEIKKIANKNKLLIIEDCAHAVFSKHKGMVLGTIGDAGCYSFFSNKNITCGEGGLIVTNKTKIAEKIRLLRSHGMTTLTLDRHMGRSNSYDVLIPGYNYRMDEIRAAFLDVQLDSLNKILMKRRMLFLFYKELLVGSEILMPFSDYTERKDWEKTAVHLVPVILPEGVARFRVMENMKKEGIQTSIHYPCVHQFTAFQGGGQSLPKTESISRRVMTLPLYPTMDKKHCRLVIKALFDSVNVSRN